MNILKEQQNTADFISSVFYAFKESEGRIKPHFIISGKSGTGKSFLVSSLVQQNKFNLINVNAAQITQEGVSGNSLSKVLSPLADSQDKPTIVFVDEFDKWFMPDTKGSTNTAAISVQNEFLKLLESSTTDVFGTYGKYVPVSLKNVLFVFAGAFNGINVESTSDLIKLGLRNEFLGRVSLVTSTKELTLESLLDYLDKSSLLSEYLNIFKTKKRSVAVKQLQQDIKNHFDTNLIGTRLVDTKIHQYFLQGV